MSSTMAAASSSSRPAKTALSSKVQGLKFMQRAEARQAMSDAVSGSGSSTPKAATTTTTQPDSPTSKAKIITLDDNPEHWSFASSSSEPAAAADHTEQVGWNSWLLESGGSGSVTGKAKKRKSVGDDAVQRTTPMGRRTFGTFAGEEEQDDDEEVDGSESTPQKKRRPHASRQRSLEPDFDEDVSMRDRSKAKKASSQTQRKQFVKPGTMSKKSHEDDDDGDDDGIDLDSFDLSESFADEEQRQGGSRRKKMSNGGGHTGDNKSRRRKSGGGGGISDR